MSNPIEDIQTTAYNKVYDILVEECGARDDDQRHDFVSTMINQPETTEFRFMGALGFGGKFWLGSGEGCDPPRVTCYQEDETPARREMIAKANARLRKLLTEAF